MPHCPVELTLNLTFREVIHAEKGNSFVTGRHLKTCWRVGVQTSGFITIAFDMGLSR